MPSWTECCREENQWAPFGFRTVARIHTVACTGRAAARHGWASAVLTQRRRSGRPSKSMTTAGTAGPPLGHSMPQTRVLRKARLRAQVLQARPEYATKARRRFHFAATTQKGAEHAQQTLPCPKVCQLQACTHGLVLGSQFSLKGCLNVALNMRILRRPSHALMRRRLQKQNTEVYLGMSPRRARTRPEGLSQSRLSLKGCPVGVDGGSFVLPVVFCSEEPRIAA